MNLMKIPSSLRIIYRAAMQFSENNDSQMGAALAYYTMFSTAPLLILAVSIAGVFYGQEAAQAQIQELLKQWVGGQNAEVIAGWMRNEGHPSGGILAATLGIILLLVGALSAFLHVRYCLCAIWHLQCQAGNSFLVTVLNYLFAILAALSVGLLLLVALIVGTATAVLASRWDQVLPGGGVFWHWVEMGISFLILTLFFAVVYRVLSWGKIGWWYLLHGSVITSFLFTLGKVLISLYLAYTSTTSIYGAAGSLVVFLVWVYYSAQIAFFGAELIQARRTKSEWMTS